MIRVITTIDAHVGGQPLRLVVDGVPRPHGKTSAQQRDWCLKHADAYRRALVNPPRGHTDITAALITDPSTLQANAGLVFMDAGGYPSMSGHAVIVRQVIRTRTVAKHGFASVGGLTHGRMPSICANETSIVGTVLSMPGVRLISSRARASVSTEVGEKSMAAASAPARAPFWTAICIA